MIAREQWDRQDEDRAEFAFKIARTQALEWSHDGDELEAILANDRDTIVRVLERNGQPKPPDIADKLGRRRASELDTEPPAPLLIERLDPSGHTILFGTGGAGKGVLAVHWTIQLVRQGHRVLLIDYENHPDEWGRRLYGLGGSDVMARVSYVAPHSPEWTADRGPIWRQAEELRELVVHDQITYLVIDSIVPACPGEDPSDPNTVSQYTAALQIIGTPALSLAHVPKAGTDLTYPFGSAFWHNLSRMTWSLEQDGENGLLTQRKHNNYRRTEKARVSVTWTDGRPSEVWERPYHRVLADRILAVMGENGRRAKEIATRINEGLAEDEKPTTESAIRGTLNRGLGTLPAIFRKEAELWFPA
jgi:AAA domain